MRGEGVAGAGQSVICLTSHRVSGTESSRFPKGILHLLKKKVLILAIFYNERKITSVILYVRVCLNKIRKKPEKAPHPRHPPSNARQCLPRPIPQAPVLRPAHRDPARPRAARGRDPGRRVAERAQKASEAHALWRFRLGGPASAPASVASEVLGGGASGMAASLWMGDVSEGGRPGLRSRNLSVTREKGTEEEGPRIPKGWK